jgi:type IV secretory pathway TraG/TraD family ATPase VirD4
MNIPTLSAIIVPVGVIIFMLWFIKKSIQAGDESKLDSFLKLLIRLACMSLLIFLTSIALSAVYVADYLGSSQKTINWLMEYLAFPTIYTLLGLTVLIVVLGLFSIRSLIPAANQWITLKVVKKSYHDSGVSDIRDISKLIPIAPDYNPLKYWDKKKNSFFIGLDPTNKPIYVSLSEWRSQHQQVLGTTGFGKGVAVTNQLAQCLAFGQSVIVFDPKNDEWAPSVLLTVAKHYNRPVCIIDLNSDSAQFNPLYGANEMEIYDLFIGGFGLAERGAESDFYRSKERRVVQQWLSQLAAGGTLTELASSLTEADYDNAPKLCNDLTELAMLGCIQTKQKGAWYDILDQGGLIYIIGSVRREPVLRLQKTLLLRIMQRLEKRDRQHSHTHVTIFLDELKYLLCKPSLQALGTIRDKSANILLAHQSINDLRDVPADLDPEAVKSAVLENTALKIVYRSQDPETAEWIAKRSGTISAHREMRDIDTTEGLAEVTKSNRRLIQSERYFIDVNTILSMPKRCSVFFSNTPAQIVLTSPITVGKVAIEPTAVDQELEEPLKSSKSQNKLEVFS